MFRLPPSLRLARSLAAMALLVLLLGLPRILVMCSEEGEAPHLAFAHAPGACCEHDHERGDVAPPDDGTPVLRANPRCEHSELAFECAPAPRPDLAKACPPTTCLGSAAACLVVADNPDDEQRHAPATGPPRPDPRLLLRTTTLLLL